MPIKLTVAAARDLSALYSDGVARFGEPHADRYYDRLLRSLDLIAANPRLGPERTEIDPPVRIHPAGVHIVVYRTDGTDVLVLRVRHHREDWTYTAPD